MPQVREGVQGDDKAPAEQVVVHMTTGLSALGWRETG